MCLVCQDWAPVPMLGNRGSNFNARLCGPPVYGRHICDLARHNTTAHLLLSCAFPFPETQEPNYVATMSSTTTAVEETKESTLVLKAPPGAWSTPVALRTAALCCSARCSVVATALPLRVWR